MAGTSITLMKGKVVVSPVEASAASPPAEILAPGQRLIFPPKGPAQRDLPAIDRLIAWQQGEVSFYATPLPQAVAEMNRYSARHIVLDAPDMEDQKLTGLYRAGDSADFAHGVAGSFGLRLVEEGAILRLTR
jgi:transmembrane sensor